MTFTLAEEETIQSDLCWKAIQDTVTYQCPDSGAAFSSNPEAPQLRVKPPIYSEESLEYI